MNINAAYLKLAQTGVAYCGEWTVKVVPWGSGFLLEIHTPRGRRHHLLATHREGMGDCHLIAQAAIRRLQA